jgi:hypothetical protein
MAARGISNIIFSETTCLVEFLLGRNVPYMTFCRVCEFQVSVHMAEGFQRRILKCEKLTDDRQRMTDAK